MKKVDRKQEAVESRREPIEDRPRRSVLLIDMGGPEDLSRVPAYLRQIFSDPFILRGNFVKRWLLSHLIARRATAETRARYEALGGKSDAVENAQILGQQLIEDFSARGLQLEFSVATRYSTPNIEQGLAALAKKVSSSGPPVTPVYLFPHETSALTGSCVDVLGRAADKLNLRVGPGVRHLASTDAYVQGWANAIRQAIEQPEKTFLLFSAHSLPLSIVNRGDVYISEVEQSVRKIRALLGDVQAGLAYQSQEGDDWLGPKVEDRAKEAYEARFRELIVVPLSFVGENTETKLDLDRDLRQAVAPLGFTRFVRLETPDKLGFLRTMVVEALCREWNLDP